MIEENTPFLTTIAVMNSTRDRIKGLRQEHGHRKRLETLEDVVIRALDLLEKNSPSVK